jgi:serine/threonine protein kinase
MDSIGSFRIDTIKKIGSSSSLHPSFDMSKSPPMPMSSIIIEKEDIPVFSRRIGPVLYLIQMIPHIRMPVIRKSLNAINGAERSYVIFDGYHGDLREYINLHKMTYRQARAIFKQLVEGVSYCHDKRIALMSLSLSHIMFGDSERTRIVIADLINALVIPQNVERISMKEGSPAYIAPEVINASQQYPYDPFKADIWSLGIIFYTLVTGQYPFFDETLDGLLKKILLNDPIEIPSFVPHESKIILRKMLNRNPAERSSIGDILADISNWSDIILPDIPVEGHPAKKAKIIIEEDAVVPES